MGYQELLNGLGEVQARNGSKMKSLPQVNAKREIKLERLKSSRKRPEFEIRTPEYSAKFQIPNSLNFGFLSKSFSQIVFRVRIRSGFFFAQQTVGIANLLT
jgi:hypothetical protein